MIQYRKNVNYNFEYNFSLKNIYIISDILRENRIIKKIVITNTKTFTFKYNTNLYLYILISFLMEI